MADGNSTKRSNRFKDLTGQQFGKWTVLSFHSRDKHYNTRWLCRCECGAERPVLGSDLRRGESRACNSCAMTRHGMSRTQEYSVWNGMVERCHNQQAKDYDRYGGRGITVCDRWRTFTLFFEDMGERPSSKHSIERRNNNLGYCPENCYWATDREQSRNKRNNRMLTFNGRTMCMKDWSEATGINLGTLSGRLKMGWSDEKALSTPVQAMKWTKTSRMLEFHGKTMCAAKWAKELGMGLTTLLGRLKAGWSVEKALTTPLDVTKRKH